MPVSPNYINNMSEQPFKLCIVSERKPGYSETFIRSHLNLISDQTISFYGNNFPCFDRCDELIVPKTLTLGERLLAKLSVSFGKSSPKSAQIKAFKRLLKREKVQVILAEYGQTGVNIYQVCQELEIPLIVHFHGFDAYNQYVLDYKGKAYPDLFQSAAAIIAVSQDMRQQLLHLQCPEEKLHYNPCGVNLELFQATQPETNPPTFVAIGRFADKKAPYLSILAFNEVAKVFPEAKLKMIGDGNLLDSCRCLVEALNLSKQVELLGSRSHEEVAAAMQGARAFVQHSVRTSYGDSEGTPVAVLEAGACGLPVIATRHAGIKDVVIENETGLLVEEKDFKGMSEYMLTLAKNPQLASQLGKAARERIQKDFSMDQSIEKLRTIIKNCLQEQ